jgi:endonuclease V-like protein UPF0215 family
MTSAPHLLGIDDGPFTKGKQSEAPLVGVMMEGHALVEGVSMSSFPVDGAYLTRHYAEWIRGMKWFPSLQGVVCAGITAAGLGIIDIESLHRKLDLPVISVTRSPTTGQELIKALTSAGYEDRIPIVEKTPPSQKMKSGIHLTCSGVDFNEAQQLITLSLNKSTLPEPIRIAHLIGAAITYSESKGNV